MRLISIFLCFIAIHNLQMVIHLSQDENKCFYQQLSLRQKYAVQISALNQGEFQLNIQHFNQEKHQWVHSVFRTNKQNSTQISLHKLASHETTYSFCLINSGYNKLSLQLNIKWGLELLDLSILAEQNDQKILEEYAQWIDEQSDTIIKTVDTVGNRRSMKEQLKNVLTFKYVIFAIIGILLVVGINLYFYSSMKRAFRQRKMI